MKGMKGLSPRASAYVWLVLGLGAGTLLWNVPSPPDTEEQWLTFAVLAACAAVAQLFPVVGPKNEAYQLTFVFVFAGLLLLPPGALVLLIVLALIPEWIKTRKPWYIQSFNIGNFLVDAFLARALYVLVGAAPGSSLQHPTALIAAVLAAGLLTFLNRLLLATVLRLARGHSWREAGLFEVGNFLTDGTLACAGIITALLWQISPWLATLIAAPLFLIYRALNTPNLQEQARTDGKTGLYNARHFYQMLREELHRAARFERPLAVIMADMDLLRNVNNTYGHLAGDVVLKGVADVIKRGLREYDLAARFGGEEFAILLPECNVEQGLVVAERLRKQVEETHFAVPTSVQPIRATLSLGVASFPTHGNRADEVIHQADLAAYYAKMRGRNRVSACSAESMALGPAVTSRGHLASVLQTFAPLSPGRQASAAANPRAVRPSCDQAEPGAGLKGGNGAPQDRKAGDVSAATVDGLRASEASAPRGSNRIGRRERAGDLTWPVALLIGPVVAAALALWALYHPWEARLDWLGLGALVVMTVASQSLAIDIHGRGRVSTGGIFVLAGGFLFGMDGVLLLALVLALATWILRGGFVYRALFDVGNTTLWGAAAVVVYEGLADRLPNSEPGLLLAPAGLAALAYYVVNVGLLSLVMGLSERRSPLSIWKERFSWLLVYYVVFGLLALLTVSAYRAIGLYGLFSFLVPPVMLRYAMKQYTDHTIENVADLKRVNLELIQAHDEAVSTLQELRTTYDATLTALSAALGSRDSETDGHSRRVVEYTAAIARQLGLPEREIPGLLNGALLHDVGKIGVPDAVLRKPGPLTPAERDAMKMHVEQGYQMLRHIGFLSDALPTVRHHHEWYDGRGYPDGLQGLEIPVGARIFAVADAFDAMTSRRPYRSGRRYEDAREEIARGAGTQFDPQIVDAFLQVTIVELARLSGRPVQPEEASTAKGQTTPKSKALPLAASAV